MGTINEKRLEVNTLPSDDLHQIPKKITKNTPFLLSLKMAFYTRGSSPP
jgi:hypothetical protein